MPITENNFTADELQAAVTANPALAAQLKTFGEKAGYKIRTNDEDTAFLGNFEKQKVDAKTFEFATNIEKDIKEVFNEDKLENEKYHDYLKRVAGKATTALASMKTELAALKADPHNSTADKQRITQLEGLIQSEKEGASGKLKEKDAQITDLKNTFEVERSLNKIRSAYVLGIPEIAITAMEQAVIADIKKSMKEIEPGKFVILDPATGLPKLDATTLAPISIENALKEKLVDIIDKQKIQTGTGTGQQQQQQQNQDTPGVIKDAAGKITDVTAVPADVKTQVALDDYLLKLGLLADSIEYNKIRTALIEKNKLPLR